MRITNPDDQTAVSRSSERMSKNMLEDLPGLNRGEAAIIGEMTRAPVMIKTRKRRTCEGGSDINIVEKLKDAAKAAKEDNTEKKIEDLRGELKGFLKGAEKNS